uniref:Uncharacterized protein n=1 Tax=Timema bartmani TaxID=61472 RepID=A0A7R9EYF5_9NEOP|nr:unnamed protein product [Timema bartmani]
MEDKISLTVRGSNGTRWMALVRILTGLVNYSSPTASLVLTDSSQLTSDSQHLDLSKNRFVELPLEVTEFYWLERLILYHNTIRAIPDNVVYLQCLKHLDLRPQVIFQCLVSGNTPVILKPGPQVIFQCLKHPDLRYYSIALEYDGWSSLDSGELLVEKSFAWTTPWMNLWIWKVTMITRPDSIPRNQLSVLPGSLCQLPLEVLLVCNNKLISLPEEIGRINTLLELDASCNEISNLPAQIGDLSILRSLMLRQNQLVQLPLGLQSLMLHQNQLVQLPLGESRDTSSATIPHVVPEPAGTTTTSFQQLTDVLTKPPLKLLAGYGLGYSPSCCIRINCDLTVASCRPIRDDLLGRWRHYRRPVKILSPDSAMILSDNDTKSALTHSPETERV